MFNKLGCIVSLNDEDDELKPQQLVKKFGGLRLMHAVNVDTISVFLSFITVQEKITSICRVSKIWFHYCWLSITEFPVKNCGPRNGHNS